MSSNTPIYDHDRGWRMWHVDEIFDPDNPDDSGRYVPNIDDLVFSRDAGFYIVISVNYQTFKSTFEPWHSPEHTGIVEDENKLLSSGAGLPPQTFRLYLDTSVIPYTLAFDSRLRVYGSTVKHVKVFQGYDIENSEIISRRYNNEGTLIGENILLETVMGESAQQSAVKTPMIGNCSKKIDDGEVVTAAFYDDAGHVVSTSSLIVKNTAWIRRAHEERKYVSAIELDSSFLSRSENDVVEVPININMESVPFKGIVHYSTGERKKLPIDGTKFKLLGLRQFISTILGQRQPLTLIYYLGDDEESYDVLDHDQGHVSKAYTITTVPIDGAYSVKLFTAPVWRGTDAHYRLKHFLFTLERLEWWDVSDKVELADNSDAFYSDEYGVNQDITFAVDLNDVDPRFANYRHLQNMRMVLLERGSITSPSTDAHWKIYYERDAAPFLPSRAIVYHVQQNIHRYQIDAGIIDLNSWLDNHFYKLQPIIHPKSESSPPYPTHFRLHIDDWSQEYDINMWDATFEVEKSKGNGDIVLVEFIRREADRDLKLVVCPFVVANVS